MALQFGTDGIRGVANTELTQAVAQALGRAAVEVLGGGLFVVGADTRESGPMLEEALRAGICGAGADVEYLGVVPTPAGAWAAADRGAAAAMISASHNPYQDNGIKLFAPGGLKLRDDVEADIEKRYLAYLDQPESLTGTSAEAPGTRRPSGGVDGWIDLITGSVAPNALAGTRLVIDCANGAAFEHGPEPFRHLGAEVVVIGDEPNGTNINDGFGSTSTEALQAKVVALGAHAGLAFDGDADRLIAVDDAGQVVDGDRVLAIMAADWSTTGRLRDNTVVVTVMSNLGFHRSMDQLGISVLSTAVGDRNVLAALDDGNFSLGGEQSGHVICRDLASTGDGVLTGVQLLDVVVRSGRPLSSLAAQIMDRVPQVLVNVRLRQREENPAAELQADIDQVTEEFGQDGRVLVRASGTEPLLRIMVEHIDEAIAADAVDRLVAAANKRFG